MSATEKLAETRTLSFASRAGSGIRRVRGCPADSTRYEQTVSDSSVHFGMVGSPRVESFIPAGLGLDNVWAVGALDSTRNGIRRPA